jgi:predicted alpha/beta-fold hydrolase
VSEAAPFRPHPLTAGGHRQTLLGFLRRRSLRWTPRSEERVFEVGPDARLLARLSWQPERDGRPLLAIVHGLNGSSESSYVVSLGRLAFERGWSVARLNLRGAGGSLPLCARLYNAGLDTDLLAVLSELALEAPRVAVAGFSLGGNLTALLATRGGDRLPPGVFALAAVSPPLDLARCADALAAPRNALYQRYYVSQLRASYRERRALRPDLFSPGLERGVRTIREYDDRITAPHGGFKDAAEYYAASSAGPWLARARRRLLVLAAADDPLIPRSSVEEWPLPAGGRVRRELTPTGGHVGFLARSCAPGCFWAADRVLAFLDESSE